jgi:phosphonopyruvate decarboxylase
MIEPVEMMRVIEKMRGDAVVVPAMRAGVAWKSVTNNINRDIPISGAMSKASSFALGFCLAQPQTKVIVYDGDGSLVMNLGSLVTIGNKAPKNMYHFLMDNGVYATTGGQDVPGAGTTDYAEVARAAGYAHTYTFDDLEDFATQAEQVLSQEGPVFVCIKAVPNIRGAEERAASQLTPARRTPEAIEDLMKEFGTRQ